MRGFNSPSVMQFARFACIWKSRGRGDLETRVTVRANEDRKLVPVGKAVAFFRNLCRSIHFVQLTPPR
jgi:hypothetical protein